MFRSPYLDFGVPNVRKTIRNIKVFTRIEGNTQINANLVYDWGYDYKLNPSGYIGDNITLKGFFYDTALYGTAVYGGGITPVLDFSVEGSFFSIQLTLSTNDTNPPYSLQGILYEYHIEGKK